MHLDGSHLIRGPREEVWTALRDPEVLVATIPGCLELREAGPDRYAVKVEAGIASLTGVYDGAVALTEQQPPAGYVLTASGQGGPGTIEATVAVDLREAEGGTLVTYAAEAVIGGAIAGIGQRVVAGVAKRTAAQFFTAVDAHVMGEAPIAGPPEAQITTAEPSEARQAQDEGAAPSGAVFRPPARPGAAGTDPRAILLGVLLGAAVALLGVLVGRRSR